MRLVRHLVGGPRQVQLPTELQRRSGGGVARDLVRRAGRDHAAALGPGTRPHVHDPVGTASGRHRARRPAGCCPGPAGARALRSGAPRPRDAGRPWARRGRRAPRPARTPERRRAARVALAPGERGRGPIEREIAQTHLTEHPQAREELGRMGSATSAEAPGIRSFSTAAWAASTSFANAQAAAGAGGHGSGTGSKSLAIAGRTLPLGHDRLQGLAPARSSLFWCQRSTWPQRPRHSARKFCSISAVDHDLISTRYPCAHRARNTRFRCPSLISARAAPGRCGARRRPSGTGARGSLALDQEPAEGVREPSLAQGLLRVGDEEIRVARPARAKAMAVGTGPDDRVEGEVPRLGASAGSRTGCRPHASSTRGDPRP